MNQKENKREGGKKTVPTNSREKNCHTTHYTENYNEKKM